MVCEWMRSPRCFTWTTQGNPENGSRMSTVDGKTYRLERSDTLLEGSWTAVQDNIPGTGAEIQVTDTNGATHSKRFYRLVVEP